METFRADPFMTGPGGRRVLRSFSLEERDRRYARVRELMESEGLDAILAGLVGTILKDGFGLENDILSIDGIVLRDFDYIDLGAVLEPPGTVPVTIKSLVFQM